MYNRSAYAIREGFCKSELTALEITEYFLSRVQLFDPQIKSFLKVLSERMMQKAVNLDVKKQKGKPLGLLAGVPIAIKDNIHIKGEITTCGSKFLSNYIAPFDATVTHLLESEDALIIGKTNLDEFAMGSSTEHSAYQVTKNPWNLSTSPGGSSGGSAAAVAARLCPVSLGSDTGGSIRQPAAFTQLVGFKPTYGIVSRFGLVAFGSSLDQIGPFTHTVKDAALIMEVLAKHCPHDATSLNINKQPFLNHLSTSIQGKKIGVPWSFLEGLSKTTRKDFEKSLDVFKNLGVSIVDINLEKLKHSIPVYYILSTAEASTNLARFDGVRFGKRAENAESFKDLYNLSREEGFGNEVKQRILLGTFVLSAGHQDAHFKKAQKIRTLIIQSYKQAFKLCDIIAMPVTPTTAFELNSIRDPIEMYLQDLYTIGANLAGIPAISVPAGLSKDHLPYGLQLIGPQMQDHKVLQYAYQFEQASINIPSVPPLFDKEADL